MRTLIDLIDYITDPLKYEWSVQGLGMLRTYVSETERLHIWHEDIRDPKASPIHDHPWSFKSEVLWGTVRQTRFEYRHRKGFTQEWNMQPIHCGEGGGLKGESILVDLEEQPFEAYSSGQVYQQLANEIHWSRPSNNCVTLITRQYGEDRDTAHVFWPKDEEWGSAEPRPATRAEILHVTRSVLYKYQEGAEHAVK